MRAVWIVIPIAIMLSALGGYILNAEDVETCETEWDYITDISGAFNGDKSDIITDYNPADNVTGWSLSSGYNQRITSGVKVDNTLVPNLYYYYGDLSGSPAGISDTLTFTKMSSSNPYIYPYTVSSTREGALSGTVNAYRYLYDNGSLCDVLIPGAPVPPPSGISYTMRAPLYNILLADVINMYPMSGYDSVVIRFSMDYSNLYYPGLFCNDDVSYYVNSTMGNDAISVQPINELRYSKITDTITAGNNTYPLNSLMIGLISQADAAIPDTGTIPNFTLQLTCYGHEEQHYLIPDSGVVINKNDPVYWNNNQINVAASIVLTPTNFLNEVNESSSEFTFRAITAHGIQDAIQIRQIDQSWSIGQIVGDLDNDPLNASVVNIQELGTWDAVMLTYGKSIKITTISDFVSFSNFKTVSDITIPWTVSGDDLIGFQVFRSVYSSYEPMRVSVVNTTIRVPEGGPYLQNAAITPLSKFPAAKAMMFVIPSVARAGQSVTFISEDNQTTSVYPVRDNKILIDGIYYDFSQVRFIWVSSTMPTRTVGTEVYPAAYYVGNNSYDASWVWAEAGGKLIKVIAGERWTMRLDGVWAPAVNYYEGDNVASITTEIMDFSEGMFRWDADTTIIFFMGSSLLLMILFSYFTRTSHIFGASIQPVGLLDWVIVIGAIACCYLIL